MDKVFKALADPSRRKLLDRLYARHGLTLGQLSARMGMSRQAVTQHLTVLEQANLISARWEGREKHHYLNAVPIHEIYHRWVRKFEERGLDALASLKKNVEGDDRGKREICLCDVHCFNARKGVVRPHRA
jgi:DNA-binding transcriptional ArsR family regulator